MLNSTLCLGLCLGAPGLYETVDAAAVEILVDDHLNGSGFLLADAGEDPCAGLDAAWLEAPCGWVQRSADVVVTAAHVVPDRTRRIEVRSASIGRVRVGVKAIDRGNDVALLRLPQREAPYPALAMADDPPHATQALWLFGSPIYRHQVLLRGYVARAQPTYEYLPDKQVYLRIFHLSAPSPPGTSGGAWIDGRGRVVGLQSGLMHDSGAPVGIAYMVPADAIRALLASGQDASTPTLGIGVEELWEQSAETLRKFPARTEGLYVAKARADGPAARAGIEVGDVITHLDGAPVALRDVLVARIRSREPGDAVRLRVWQAGRAPKEVPVKLARLESLR